MLKKSHEIRDPVHNFIQFDAQERDLLNSRPFQRLRHIHQLGMSHFIYPGANHTRFEHSLGVMELATRIFDNLTRPERLTDAVKEVLSGLDDEGTRDYWRRTLRMAALCHDLGHLPFSHAAEKELLPEGYDHEKLTVDLIHSGELQGIWTARKPELKADDVAKLSVGPAKWGGEGDFTSVEALLSEIITGDVFGADRMDYLLRDSHHAGVAYGRFDHYRLIDTLVIVPTVAEETLEPSLGVEDGGLHAAEGLLVARYFMFKQVYFHHVRRIYDIHLMDFLKQWLPNGCFATSLDGLLAMTDNEVMAGILEEARDAHGQSHELARRIADREHFRRVYQPSSADLETVPDARRRIYAALADKFGAANVRDDYVAPKGALPEFTVVCDGELRSSINISDVVVDLPQATVDLVFVRHNLREKARRWLDARKASILNKEGGTDGESG